MSMSSYLEQIHSSFLYFISLRTLSANRLTCFDDEKVKRKLSITKRKREMLENRNATTIEKGKYVFPPSSLFSNQLTNRMRERKKKINDWRQYQCPLRKIEVPKNSGEAISSSFIFIFSTMLFVLLNTKVHTKEISKTFSSVNWNKYFAFFLFSFYYVSTRVNVCCQV